MVSMSSVPVVLQNAVPPTVVVASTTSSVVVKDLHGHQDLEILRHCLSLSRCSFFLILQWSASSGFQGRTNLPTSADVRKMRLRFFT